MEVLSYIVLILFSLVGYAAGAVSKAGKSVQPKPEIIDLILVAVIWAGAIYSRMAVEADKWLLILVWVMLSAVIGVLAVWPRKSLPEIASIEKTPGKKEAKQTSKNPVKKLWRAYQDFFIRVGAFQSGIVLSIIFFILISPFALGVKIFSDPLRLKHQDEESNWLPRISAKPDLEQSRRQF